MAVSLFRLDGTGTVVVGAGSGIGAAVARGCAEHGAYVTCLDLDGDKAEQTAASIRNAGGEADGAVLDIRDGSAVDEALANVLSRGGSVDAVISTPGINVRKPLLRYSDEEFDRVVDLNLKGTMHVLQSAGRLMAAAGAGSIIVFSSIRSLVVEPGQSVYAATKAGLVQMVRALAAELGPSGVRVNAVAPGVVETPLTAPIKMNQEWYDAYATKNVLGRWASPEEMIGPTVFLASAASSYVTGSVLLVDGGWTAVDGRFEPPGM